MAHDVPIGRVASVTPTGALVVKAPGPLSVQMGGRRGDIRIGMAVMDARRESAGRIADVIGPVASPYVIVQAERGAKLHRLLGRDLFAGRGAPASPGPVAPPRHDARGPAEPMGARGPPPAHSNKPSFRPRDVRRPKDGRPNEERPRDDRPRDGRR